MYDWPFNAHGSLVYEILVIRDNTYTEWTAWGLIQFKDAILPV